MKALYIHYISFAIARNPKQNNFNLSVVASIKAELNRQRDVTLLFRGIVGKKCPRDKSFHVFLHNNIHKIFSSQFQKKDKTSEKISVSCCCHFS